MIRVELAAIALALLAGAAEQPIRLVCLTTAGDGGRVALELDEANGSAKALDPYFLRPIDNIAFAIVYFTPTKISLIESKEDKTKFWLLDRITGRLYRNSPPQEYHCTQGRQF